MPRLKIHKPSKRTKPAAKRDVAKRWTPDLAKDGWTPISNFFLEHYTDSRLPYSITTPEAMLIIHLMLHKWDEAPPFPAAKTLAKRMGITPTAVRNHMRSLENKGYLHRTVRLNQPNLFDLNPLFNVLEKLRAKLEAEKAEGARQAV